MKSIINYSYYSKIVTFLVGVLLYIGCVVTVHEKSKFFILLAIFVVVIMFGLLYGAGYIKADSDYIILGSIIKRKKIPMRNVESVELFQPTMGSIRIVGSGGFMGYWGLFREGDIGRYYAFYGKSSECFLIRMKNGDKYVLGCDRPDKMVDYIKEHIM